MYIQNHTSTLDINRLSAYMQDITSTEMQSPTNTPCMSPPFLCFTRTYRSSPEDETDTSNAAGEDCHASGQLESKDDVTYLHDYDMTVEQLKSLDLRLYTDSENHDNTAQPMETLKRISSSHGMSITCYPLETQCHFNSCHHYTVQEDSVTLKIDNPEATDSPMVCLPARPRLITHGFESKFRKQLFTCY